MPYILALDQGTTSSHPSSLATPAPSPLAVPIFQKSVAPLQIITPRKRTIITQLDSGERIEARPGQMHPDWLGNRLHVPQLHTPHFFPAFPGPFPTPNHPQTPPTPHRFTENKAT